MPVADYSAHPNSFWPPHTTPHNGTVDASRGMLGEPPITGLQTPDPSFMPSATRFLLRPTDIPGRGSSIPVAAASSAAIEDPPVIAARATSHRDDTIRSSRVSRHVREGALSQINANDDQSSRGVAALSSTTEEPSAALDSSPERFRQWKRTMEGLLDGQGIEEDLHRELGLSAASLSSFVKGNTESTIPVAQVAKVFPANLGRSQSVKRTETGGSHGSSALATPPEGVVASEKDETGSHLSHSLQGPAGSISLSQPISLNGQGITVNEDIKALRASSSLTNFTSMSEDDDELELYGKTLAAEMYNGDETHVKKEQVAAYLGGR